MLGETLWSQVMNIHYRTCLGTDNNTGHTVTITVFYNGLQEIFKPYDDIQNKISK